MNAARKGLVFLVGAGPGDPGLLTLRAVECLRQADLVLYDKLVPPRVVDYAPPTAKRICVRDLIDYHGEQSPRVHQTMIEAARRGECVVRLKGGDPFIFGRGGEEAEALVQAGVEFEIVPGVTAALAAGACAGIPLTHRDLASCAIFATGHENPAKPESAVAWEVLAKSGGTLAIYMGVSRLGQIVGRLLVGGLAPETPSAVVQWAATGEQHTVEAPLAELPTVVQAAGVSAPAIVLVGAVVGLRGRLGWFEHRPLFGKRVLVTRPRRQATDFVRRLESLGAIPFVLPAIDIRPLDDYSACDRALAQLARFQWLVFTSVNGVEAFVERLVRTGRDLRALSGVKLAAIGPATADALAALRLRADLVPTSEFRSEGLAEALRPHVVGQRVLLARADRGRDVLPRLLADVADVEQVAVYSQIDVVSADAEELNCLRRGEIDFVTLTSANVARAFLRSLDETCLERIASGQVKLATLSPVTSEAVAEWKLPVSAEATTYTMQGLLDALITLARQG
jgi:uroporphyrinogen III methyltransferase/synthase